MERSALMVTLALAAATFALRYLPFATLARLSLPSWAEEWLRLVPGAVLAATLAQTLLFPDGHALPPWQNAHLLAAGPAIVIAWRTRNVLVTMIVGVGSYALLSLLLTG